MRKLLIVPVLVAIAISGFAGIAGANEDGGGRKPIPTTTAPTPTTTAVPTPTTVPAPPTTTPRPTPTTTAVPTPTTTPRPTPRPVPPAETPEPAPEPAPAAPTANAVIDCARGIVVTASNAGGQSATLTVVVDGNVVGDLRVPAGESREFTLDLNPEHAGRSLVVQVRHGDAILFDQALAVTCGDTASLPCAAPAPAAGTPAVEAPATGGCTNPCWWAPAALLAGIFVGRRRRNGHINPVGVAVGGAAAFLALRGLGFGWSAAAIAAAALLAASWWVATNKKHDGPGEDRLDEGIEPESETVAEEAASASE